MIDWFIAKKNILIYLMYVEMYINWMLKTILCQFVLVGLLIKVFSKNVYKSNTKHIFMFIKVNSKNVAFYHNLHYQITQPIW